MVKGWIGKAKCRLGAHAGDWAYAATQDCTLLRICSRCGAASHRTRHCWAAWEYRTAADCQQARRCDRCDESQERVTHEWGQARYQAEGSCDRMQVCLRCGEGRPAQVLHMWGSEEYVSDGGCARQRRCDRCGISKAAGIAHQCSEWQSAIAGEDSARSCQRCRSTEHAGARSAASHAMGTSKPDKSGPDPNTPRPDAEVKASRAQTLKNIKEKGDELAKLQESLGDVLNAMLKRGEETLSRVESPQPFPQSERDHRLIGDWRGTDVLSSGGMSLVTHLYLSFDAAGGFVFSTQHTGPAGSSALERKGEGKWRISESGLNLSWSDGSSSDREYQVQGRNLLLPKESQWPRLWHAV